MFLIASTADQVSAEVGWVQIDSGTDIALFVIDPVDDQNLWVSGALGTIRKTNDGGETWNSIDPGTGAHFWSLDATDSLVAIAGGGAAGLFRTEDGGESWDLQLSTQFTFEDIYAVDADTAWASVDESIGVDGVRPTVHRKRNGTAAFRHASQARYRVSIRG